MAATQQAKSTSGYNIKTIWGLAKSPELSLDKDTLYTIIERETAKTSMRQLDKSEIAQVCRVLIRMKDTTTRETPPMRRRSDQGGNPQSIAMRRKIYIMAKELGWNDDSVNGLAFKIFGISRQEWLSTQQCSGLIAALGKMAAKQQASSKLESYSEERGVNHG